MADEYGIGDAETDVRKKEEAEDYLLPAHWQDDHGRRWTCRFDVPMVLRYCGEQDLAYRREPGRRAFSPFDLNGRQLMDLALLGSRWNQKAQGKKRFPGDRFGEETRAEFYAAHSNDLSAANAILAARAAVINFILRHQTPPALRLNEAAKYKRYESVLASHLSGATDSPAGPSPTSATPATTPAFSTSTTPVFGA